MDNNNDSNNSLDSSSLINLNSMLTTNDNPYNPFTQFDDWYAFDVNQGYNTCAYLSRIALSSDDLSEVDQAISVEKAIDEIVSFNILGIYKKVTEEDFKNPTLNKKD